jgi:acetyltransferase-like isoleucine patch superfamily enzyme
MHRSQPIDDPLSWIPRILTKLHSFWVSATYPFAAVGRNLSVHYTCELKRSVAHRLRLGESVYIAKDAWLNVTMASVGQTPAIILDDRCVVARRSMISAKNCIHLEQDVILSASVLIMDHAHAYEDVSLPIEQQGVTEGGTIRIEQGCWIGHGAAIVCNGGELVIGKNSVIAANALVTRRVPPYSVVSGNPGRVLKQYDPVQKKWVLGSARPAPAEGKETKRVERRPLESIVASCENREEEVQCGTAVSFVGGAGAVAVPVVNS